MFIIHPKRLLNRISKDLTSSFQDYLLIDVSFNLPSPQLLPHSNELLLPLRKLQLDLQNEQDEIHLECSSAAITVVGYLLRYPILYFSNPQTSNCLSRVPLRVCHVTIEGESLCHTFSFSFPTSFQPKVSLTEWFALESLEDPLTISFREEEVTLDRVIL